MENWERIRWHASITINPHTKRTLKPTDLMKFPWEKNKATKALSKEEIVSRLHKLEAKRKYKKLETKR